MAKGRIILKSISTSEKVNVLIQALNKTKSGLGYFGGLLYTWLNTHLDDYGRIDGSPFHIKHNVVPALESEKEVILALTAMDCIDLIVWYEVNGKKIIFDPKFEEVQIGLSRRTESKYPQWSNEFPRISVNFREFLGNSCLIELNRIEQNRTELEGKGTRREGEGEVSGTPPPYQLILNDLNSKLHKKFQITDNVRKDINARWKTGKYILEDFFKVHDIKINEWNHPPGNGQKDMRPYLRPSTLYGNKFDGYLNQVEPNKDDNRFSESGRKTIQNLTEDLQERGLLNG